MTAKKIIIDTDPGQDDAVAILLALASPELDVLGIVAVAGNVPLHLTEVNCRKICELAERPDIKVYAGCDRPMLRPLVTAEYVHGNSGLDGPDLPAPQMPLQAEHGVDFLIRSLREQQDVTVCMLGPLTNLAVALTRAPEIAGNIAQVVMMGGGFFEGGNVTPAAEFNIYVDPHAAAKVFASGLDIVIHPLDVTHQALTTTARVQAFRDMGSKVGTATAELLDYFERYDEQKYGTDGGPLHDPNVIAWLLQPDLYQGKDCNVEIETNAELTLGATVIDWWHRTDRPVNAHVIRHVDADGFFALITARLARL